MEQSDPTTHLNSTVDKSRSRKSLSCLPCRKRKVKCDYKLPCGQCNLRGKSDLCVYEENNRWGYSRPQTLVVKNKSEFTLEACLVKLKASKLLPDKDVSNALFQVYKSHCHPIIPILDITTMENVYQMIITQGNSSIEDTASLLILFAIAYRATSDERHEISVALEIPLKLGEMAHRLVCLLNPLQIASLKTFKLFFMYSIYIYWEDSPFSAEVSSLMGLLQGALRGSPKLRKNKEINDLFSLVEGCVAINMGLNSITSHDLIFAQDDLFLKCRFALIKYRDRICSQIYAVGHELEPKIIVDLEQEIKNTGATYSILQMNRMTTSLARYQLLVLNAMCNQTGLLLYRPFLVTKDVQNTFEAEVWRRKALGFAVGMIEVALEYTRQLSGQFMFFSWNDIYMGAFQAAILLIHDHFERQHHKVSPDTAKPYARFALRAPPFETELFRELWMSGSTNWRYEIAERCYQMFLSMKTGPSCRSSKAALILGAFLNEAKYLQVPEFFGSFTKVLEGYIPPPNDRNFAESLYCVEFNSLDFTQLISSRTDTEFEQFCNEAINHRVTDPGKQSSI